jgi:hypothetical protein
MDCIHPGQSGQKEVMDETGKTWAERLAGRRGPDAFPSFPKLPGGGRLLGSKAVFAPHHASL